MNLITESRGQRKESINLNTDQSKYSNQITEKTDLRS